MSLLPLELLILEPMASGGQSLRLTDRVTWREFPAYAKAVLEILEGRLENRADSPVERVWSVVIRDAPFWIAFDDFALGVSLEPRTPDAANLVPVIRAHLMQIRETGELT